MNVEISLESECHCTCVTRDYFSSWPTSHISLNMHLCVQTGDWDFLRISKPVQCFLINRLVSQCTPTHLQQVIDNNLDLLAFSNKNANFLSTSANCCSQGYLGDNLLSSQVCFHTSYLSYLICCLKVNDLCTYTCCLVGANGLSQPTGSEVKLNFRGNYSSLHQ